MDNQTFKNISRIIERDSKVTTYKFALLRGVIDIIQDDSPYIRIEGEKVFIPLGLMIEKWLVFYYPILNSLEYIPQIHISAKLAFEDKFRKIISYYNRYNGVSELYNNLRRQGVSQEIESEFIDLTKCLQRTISEMPMKYIGKSISNDYYSIFQYHSAGKRTNRGKLDFQWLIDTFGSFSIPLEYYEAFKILGSFISGTDSILFKWADFSVNASGQNLSKEKVISEILKSPITEREISVSKKLYKSILHNSTEIECVWTGVRTSNYDIDHMIPFSVWRNNDLWNLLPVRPKVNKAKRDKIPSAFILDQRKDAIIHYWEIINESQNLRFLNEMQIALLGIQGKVGWQNKAFSQLKLTCANLINIRACLNF